VPDPKDAAAVAERKRQVRAAFDRRFAATAKRYPKELAAWYGEERGGKVQYAEAFEICEYGRMPTPEELRELFPFYATTSK
jgi:hypothetical protein